MRLPCTASALVWSRHICYTSYGKTRSKRRSVNAVKDQIRGKIDAAGYPVLAGGD